MGKTDVIDYAEICNHAKRKHVCPACAEIAALREENERLKGELEHWTSGAKSLLEWLYNGKLPEIPRPEES